MRLITTVLRAAIGSWVQAFGLFVRYAADVRIARSSFSVAAGATDARPAIVIDQVHGMVRDTSWQYFHAFFALSPHHLID